MWILPKPIISAFAPGTEALISDSDEFSQVAEQSLMWRSKPSQSRTWSQRWKRENWIKHLSGRTLRRSRQNNFTDWWTSSLAGTRANRSVPLVSDEEPKTQDISGRFCAEQFELFDQVESSLKTSKDTYRLDSPRYSAIWTKMVTEQRGEYSARLKSARATRESESSSWPTPRASGQNDSARKLNKSGKRHAGDDLTTAVKDWPTASARDWKDNPGEWMYNGKNPDGTTRNRIDQLARAVYHNDSPQDPVNRNSIGKNPGRLSPNWVEQLMGVPTSWTQLPIEWTDFDSSETELSRQPQQKHGQS
jgi:hypothetical protein